MIYIKLFVNNKNISIDFYVKKLGIFDLLGDSRLICKSGPQLILDLQESETSSQINFGIRYEYLTIIPSLEKFNIPYKLENNLAGQHLYFEDPDKNTLWITTASGEIK